MFRRWQGIKRWSITSLGGFQINFPTRPLHKNYLITETRARKRDIVNKKKILIISKRQWKVNKKKYKAKFPLLRLKLTENKGALVDLETNLKTVDILSIQKQKFIFSQQKNTHKKGQKCHFFFCYSNVKSKTSSNIFVGQKKILDKKSFLRRKAVRWVGLSWWNCCLNYWRNFLTNSIKFRWQILVVMLKDD